MEEAMTRRGTPAHVLAIPFLLQGHLYPLLWFSKRLALKGTTVTFLAYEETIRLLTSQQEADENQVYGKYLHFKVLPKIKRPDVKLEIHEEAAHLRKEFEPILNKYVEAKQTGRELPTCIISDMFLLWTQDVAEQLQIPRYMLITSGATLAVLTGGFLRLYEKGGLEISEKNGLLVKNDKGYSIPGIPHLAYHEMPYTCIKFPAMFLARSRILWRAAGVLVNSFTELEEQIIESFKVLASPDEFGSDRKAPKLYSVGPMRSITPDFAANVTLDQSQQDQAERALTWLSSQPHSSVLYVAFGTLVSLSEENIHELALALEASQQRFLWVLRGSSTDALPDGFNARVGERGWVVAGWVPQVKILAHPSTAAFLTHCGWNSILESILMGLPMIGWPLGAEQHLNCRDLTDRLKIVEQIHTGPENTLHQAEAVRAIRLVMVEPEGKIIKERVKQVQKSLAEASAEGGSQSKAVQVFLDDIGQPL